jgi:hypothetical protein
MSNDLVTWKQEPTTDETWAEILGTINEDEIHAYNRAPAEAQKQTTESDLYTIGESELLARWQKEAQKLEAKSLLEKRAEAARQFMVEAPEVVDSEKNGERLGQYFQAAGLSGDDPDHFHAAYKALASRDLIQINEDKRPRQPRKHLTEQSMYEMPLEDLEDLARKAR